MGGRDTVSSVWGDACFGFGYSTWAAFPMIFFFLSIRPLHVFFFSYRDTLHDKPGGGLDTLGHYDTTHSFYLAMESSTMSSAMGSVRRSSLKGVILG